MSRRRLRQHRRRVGGTLGVDASHPLRRQVAGDGRTDTGRYDADDGLGDDGFHFRVRDRRVLILWPDSPPSGYDITFDRDTGETRACLPSRMPVPCLRVSIDRRLLGRPVRCRGVITPSSAVRLRWRICFSPTAHRARRHARAKPSGMSWRVDRRRADVDRHPLAAAFKICGGGGDQNAAALL